MKKLIKIKVSLALSLLLIPVCHIFGQGDGFIIKEGKRIFPIGFYSVPKDKAMFDEMIDAGVNLIRCNSRTDLDRAQSAGIQGWVPIPLHNGVTEDFKKKVQSMAGHPALAIWEGPDEIVWNFTEATPIQGRWGDQPQELVEYAREKSDIIMPNIKESISYIRSIDPNNLQVWINEALSEPFYVRKYIDYIDITGMDYYPIITQTNNDRFYPWRSTRDIGRVGFFTDRYKEIGRGKPVWMVLQAFSYSELGSNWANQPVALPSFNESRYMAYIALTHGVRGIFYYGSNTLKSEECRQSIYSLTSELDALQKFLTTPEQEGISVYVIKDWEPKDQTVSWIARQFGREWMIALVNETDLLQRGVVITGLKHLDQMEFVELYGDEKVLVENEEFMTRLKPNEVKVFATSKKWETKRQNGRNYQGVPVQGSK